MWYGFAMEERFSSQNITTQSQVFNHIAKNRLERLWGIRVPSPQLILCIPSFSNERPEIVGKRVNS
jgi:hypothetical protein